MNATSSSNSHITQETQTPFTAHDAEEDNHDIEVAHMGNDPYFGIPIPKVASGQYLSSDVIYTIVPLDHQVSEHNSKWTKDHPLENISGCSYRSDLGYSPWWKKSKLDEIKKGHCRSITLSWYDWAKPSLSYMQARSSVSKGTVHRGLWYPKDSSFALTAFADADHAGCQDTRRSTSGSIQLLGDRLVSWSSKRQKSAAISSTEAEYIALSDINWRTSALKALQEDLKFLINKLGMRSFTPETLKKLADDVDE
ncbi:hypothetical protein Tco_0517320 [Tanacetum coccineum]